MSGELARSRGCIQITISQAGAALGETDTAFSADGSHCDNAQRLFPLHFQKRGEQGHIFFGISHRRYLNDAAHGLRAFDGINQVGEGWSLMKIVEGNDAGLTMMVRVCANFRCDPALQFHVDGGQLINGFLQKAEAIVIGMVPSSTLRIQPKGNEGGNAKPLDPSAFFNPMGIQPQQINSKFDCIAKCVWILIREIPEKMTVGQGSDYDRAGTESQMYIFCFRALGFLLFTRSCV